MATGTMAHDGAGAVLTIGAAVGRVISIGSYTMSRDVIDDTDLGDTIEQAKPGTLVRHEPFEVEAYFDPELPPFSTYTNSITGAAGADVGTLPNSAECSIAYPTSPDQTAGSILEGDGFITEISTAPLRHGENLIYTFSIKWVTTPNVTASS